MMLDERIKDQKLRCYLNRGAAKKFAILSGDTDIYMSVHFNVH